MEGDQRLKLNDVIFLKPSWSKGSNYEEGGVGKKDRTITLQAVEPCWKKTVGKQVVLQIFKKAFEGFLILFVQSQSMS